MRYRAALAGIVVLLVACDRRAPTAPAPDLSPQFQTGQDRVSVSLSRNAELVIQQFGSTTVAVEGAFVCPEGNTASFQVNVTQAKPNGQIAGGSSFATEACRFGSNKWSVTVSGIDFDVGPAVATVVMNSAGPAGVGFDSDQGEIHIRTP